MRTTATMPDGSIEPVSTFSYFKYKVKFYQISSPIIGDLYFHRSSSVSELAFKIYRIDKELSDFFESLPPELKLTELFRNPSEKVSASTRPFMLQALALQIAYDNVQILLHRPLLSQDLRQFKNPKMSSNMGGIYSPDQSGIAEAYQLSSQHVHQILLASRDKCWESALRSSKLGQYQQCLVAARDSHAAAFLGINLFTAGMILSCIALSKPLSDKAQIAKQAVARIMTLSRFLSGKALLSAQTLKILKDLVRLIGEKEIKAMLSETDLADTMPPPATLATSRQLALTDGIENGSKEPQSDLTRPDDVPEQVNNSTTTQLQNEFSLNGLENIPDFSDNFDFTGFENIDFNNGLSIMQQAMFPDLSAVDMNQSTDQQPLNLTDGHSAENSYFNPATGSDSSGLHIDDFNMMNTVGQTWLWDSAPW
jgi:hypothetical protein